MATVKLWLATNLSFYALRRELSLRLATLGYIRIIVASIISLKIQNNHDYRCDGEESNLLRCPHTELPKCGVNKVAGVTCIKTVTKTPAGTEGKQIKM